MHKGIDIKGIGNVVLKTAGTVELKLLTATHETSHLFHVLEEPSALQCDGILGKDFLEEKESIINYCSRQIIMNDEVIVNFDEKIGKPEPCRLTLQARTEHIVNVPTNHKGLGILNKSEITPGVFLAASLTTAKNGVCPTSIVNTTEKDQMISLPLVELEQLSEREGAMTFALSAVADSDCTNRLNTLRNSLRLQHLNAEERISIVEICQEFNDIFHLPNDKLTCTSTIEHAIPTPTVDPHRAINLRQYRIPQVHREEVRKQTEKMLADGVIQHSTSPWNSPILVVPKKTRRLWQDKVEGRGGFPEIE